LKHIALVSLLAVGLFAAALRPSIAQDSMQSSSMMTTMPACASGDKVVAVNMNTKMYVTQDQMKKKTAGMSQPDVQAMMAKNHVKMMCRSQADAMGAKMATPPPM
jgi:hydroxymethylglutaryl-CoA reductase